MGYVQAARTGELAQWESIMFNKIVAGVSTFLLTGVAMAATTVPLDTADAVGQIGEINTAVAAVGAALVAAAAIAVGFKWLKAAIFG